MSYGDLPFGLNDIKITDITGSTQVDLPRARVMQFAEALVQAELTGDDKTIAVASISDKVEWSLESGGIPLEAYALMTGRTVVTAGSSPNETKTLTVKAGESFPYFKVYGKSLGDGDGADVHILIKKCKLTSAPEGSFGGAEFFVTSQEKRKSGKTVQPPTPIICGINYRIMMNQHRFLFWSHPF